MSDTIPCRAAEVLDHAHEHGVIHGDVKASNVILNNGGKLWGSDCGLVRIETDESLSGFSESDVAELALVWLSGCGTGQCVQRLSAIMVGINR